MCRSPCQEHCYAFGKPYILHQAPCSYQTDGEHSLSLRALADLYMMQHMTTDSAVLRSLAVPVNDAAAA